MQFTMASYKFLVIIAIAGYAYVYNALSDWYNNISVHVAMHVHVFFTCPYTV